MAPTGHVDSLTPDQHAIFQDYLKRLHIVYFPASNLELRHLSIWGVSLLGMEQELTRSQTVVLLKFLRARNWNVEHAARMLLGCLKWRKEFDVEGLMKEEFPPELSRLGYIYGCDMAGHPVTYNYYDSIRVSDIFGVPGGLQRFLRWRVQLMEKAVRSLDLEKGVEKVMQVHDYSGVSLFSLDKNIKDASKSMIKLFQDNYPEMLSCTLMLNVPTLLEFLFGIVNTFADPETKKKIQWVSSGNARGMLLSHISAEQLPAQYGGFAQTDPSWGPIMELTVPAGAKHEFDIPVTSGSEFQWYYITNKGDITLRVLADGGMLQEKNEYGKGRMAVANSGQLKLMFDNSNWFKETVVHFRTRLLKGSA